MYVHDNRSWGTGGGGHTLKALHAVQLREQLVNDTVSDASAVVPPLRRYGVKLVKEEDAGSRRCRSPGMTQDQPGYTDYPMPNVLCHASKCVCTPYHSLNNST